MVPSTCTPTASACAPTISKPSSSGMRSRSQTPGRKLSGAAVPLTCVPVMEIAGPAPSIIRRAPPSPRMATGPTRSSRTTSGRVIR